MRSIQKSRSLVPVRGLDTFPGGVSTIVAVRSAPLLGHYSFTACLYSARGCVLKPKGYRTALHKS